MFIGQFLDLLIKFRDSWVLPGHHAIILTDASDQWMCLSSMDVPQFLFAGCASCAFAKIKYRNLGGLKGTTSLKKIPLCIVKASFCCLSPFLF